MPRFRRPSPAFVLAALALGLSVSGFAVAAIPDKKGSIHACYAKRGGAVRVISGTRCRRTEHRLAWSVRGRTGTPGHAGAPGRDGAALPDGAVTSAKLGATIVRRRDFPLADTSAVSGDAPCAAGERVVGGGASTALVGDDVDVQASYPSDTSGTPLNGQAPTAWYAHARNGSGGVGPTTLHVFVLCLQ